MTRSLLTITILSSLALYACSQPVVIPSSPVIENKQPVRALAKMLSPTSAGDKIRKAKFYIIKDLGDSGSTTLTGRTIEVGHVFTKPVTMDADTVLLTVYKYSDDPTFKDYYIFPDYDGDLGVQKVKLDVISFEHWEACEMGKPCPAITFTRRKEEHSWFLLMPCGGTQTSVTVSGIDNSFSKEINLTHENCPPWIELTNLPDGKYSAYMLACGLGGGVNFTIKTDNDGSR